ncbi:MAG TPA: two-component regulator propeller domain-containing protein, partial [Clostridia bacterium]|nr:two-component regulator propeller domain-containing protein [Clostridia bacterium]
MKTALFTACCLLLLALACEPWQAFGGEGTVQLREYSVRTWGKKEGLPDASVTAVLQARDAYLWIGTGAGLFRFDGMKFTEIALGETGTTTPVTITALAEDSTGCLWIGTEHQGLFCLRGESIKRFGVAEGLSDEEVTSLTIDTQNRLWVGTRQGVTQRDAGGFTVFKVEDGLPDDFVSNVHAARSGAIWITTRRGMCSFVKDRIAPFEFQLTGKGRIPEFLGAYEDLRTNLWAFGSTYLINVTGGKRFNYFHEEQSASMRIWSLCEGKDGRLWIGTSGGGLFCFDGSKFQPVTLTEGRWLNDVRAICEDSEGNLWLGISEGGLTRLQPQIVTTFKGNQGLPSGPATCLGLDNLGRVNVGVEWRGIFIHVGQRFEKVSDQYGFTGLDSVCSLTGGQDFSLWVGTAGSGLCQIRGGRTARFTTANGLSDDCVLATCGEADGSIWAGTYAGTLHQLKAGNLTTYGPPNGLPGNPITVLTPAENGGVWVGTENGMVFRCYRGAVYPVRAGGSFGGSPILALYEDSAQRMWIGTSGGGLGC